MTQGSEGRRRFGRETLLEAAPVLLRRLLSSSSGVGAHSRFWRITQENGLSLRPEMAPRFRLYQPSCPPWRPSCLCSSLLSPFFGHSAGRERLRIGRCVAQALVLAALFPSSWTANCLLVRAGWSGARRGGGGKARWSGARRGGASGARRRRDQSASARDTGCKTGRAFPK